MNNPKYVYQIGGHFRFVKLFDKVEEAIAYVCRISFYDQVEDIYGTRELYMNNDIDSRDSASLMRELKDILISKNMKKTKLMFRAINKPRFEVDENIIASAKKTANTVEPLDFRKGHGCQGIYVRWEAQIEVCLQYTEELGEVKVEGQPYEPARVVEGQTEWYKVYKMQGKSPYSWRLSIDDTSRNLPTRGSYNDSVPMDAMEYWHRITGCTIELTTTE